MKRTAAILVASALLSSGAFAQTPPTSVFGLDMPANNALAVPATNHARFRFNSATGYIEQAVGASSTYFAVSGSQVANIKAFGAKCDGTTNDTTAINNAITTANGLIDVYIPPGTCVTTGITVSTPNTRIIGTAGSTLFLAALPSGTGSPNINVTVSGVEIRGLTIDGNKANQPADGFSDSFNSGPGGTGRAYRAGIVVWNSGGGTITGVVIDNVTLTNTYGAGIASQNAIQFRIMHNTSTNLNFELGFISTTFASGTYITDIDISHNLAINCASGDPSVNANAFLIHQAQNLVFANNIVDSVERDGLKCESCTEGAIVGNVIRHVTMPNFPGIQLQTDASDMTVTGNKITDAGGGINMNSSGATTIGYQNIVVSSNAIDNIHGAGTPDGIEFFPGTGFTASNIKVVGNVITSYARYCVYFDFTTASASDVTANDNTCISTGSTNAAGVLLVETTNSSSGITLIGNHVDLGNVAAQGGINFTSVTGGTFGNVLMTGNQLITGAAHLGIFATSGAITSGLITSTLTDGNISLAGSTITQGDSTFTGAVSFTGASFSATPTGAITLTAGAISTWNTLNGTVEAATFDTSSGVQIKFGSANATSVVIGKTGISFFSASDTFQFSTSTAATAKNLTVATTAVDTAGNGLTVRAGAGGAASASGGGLGGTFNGVGGSGGAASTSFGAGVGGPSNNTGGQGGTGAVGHGPGTGGIAALIGGSCGADGGSGILCNAASAQINGGVGVNGGTDGASFIGNTRGAVNVSRSGGTLGFFGGTAVVQQATTGTTAGFTANASANAVFNESTWTGNTGAAAYTISDIVLALKNYRLLAP